MRAKGTPGSSPTSAAAPCTRVAHHSISTLYTCLLHFLPSHTPVTYTSAATAGCSRRCRRASAGSQSPHPGGKIWRPAGQLAVGQLAPATAPPCRPRAEAQEGVVDPGVYIQHRRRLADTGRVERWMAPLPGSRRGVWRERVVERAAAPRGRHRGARRLWRRRGGFGSRCGGPGLIF